MHKKNVIHRDLKPENVMLCNDGSLRIMDFGIAKAAGLRRLTFTGFSPVMGTPDYMAPEQVKGKRGDERTDIYSLGAMLYEMVTGAVPFEGANPYIIMNSRLTGDPPAPRKVHSDIPPQVEEIILHAMERNPAERYPSAAAMKAELDDPEKVELTGRCDRLTAAVAGADELGDGAAGGDLGAGPGGAAGRGAVGPALLAGEVTDESLTLRIQISPRRTRESAERRENKYTESVQFLWGPLLSSLRALCVLRGEMFFRNPDGCLTPPSFGPCSPAASSSSCRPASPCSKPAWSAPRTSRTPWP